MRFRRVDREAALLTACAVAAASALAGVGTARDRTGVDCGVARCVALTYDDGPSRHTISLVDALDAAGAPATFFFIGQEVGTHADAVRYADAHGVVIGTHSWSHPHLPRIPLAQQQLEVDRGVRAVEQVTGRRPVLFRPPYGSWDASTRTLGVPLIMWNVDTRDWDTHSAPATLAAVRAQVRRGSIILLHDGEESSVQVTGDLVRWLRAEGYTLVTVPELIGVAEPGTVHRGQYG